MSAEPAAPDAAQLPLLRIRSERDQMSAIERRIADFLLDNAHLLRDYSSQQLADALGISQSSVVKFSQKLGFKGYPDLKFSVGAAVARSAGATAEASTRAPHDARPAQAADGLWRDKARAEEETALINPPAQLDAAIDLLAGARRVYVGGLGADGLRAQQFALQLASLGVCAICHTDPLLLDASLAAADAGDAMVLLCEQGRQPELGQIARAFRSRHGRLLTLTRHTANPLRTLADVALLVSAHEERAHIQPLLYAAACQHLLDRLFVRLCESAPDGLARHHAYLARQHALPFV